MIELNKCVGNIGEISLNKPKQYIYYDWYDIEKYLLNNSFTQELINEFRDEVIDSVNNGELYHLYEYILEDLEIENKKELQKILNLILKLGDKDGTSIFIWW